MFLRASLEKLLKHKLNLFSTRSVKLAVKSRLFDRLMVKVAGSPSTDRSQRRLLEVVT